MSNTWTYFITYDLLMNKISWFHHRCEILEKNLLSALFTSPHLSKTCNINNILKASQHGKINTLPGLGFELVSCWVGVIGHKHCVLTYIFSTRLTLALLHLLILQLDNTLWEPVSTKAWETPQFEFIPCALL